MSRDPFPSWNRRHWERKQAEHLDTVARHGQSCCASPAIVEAVDERGRLIEPAYDVCVCCGKEFH